MNQLLKTRPFLVLSDSSVKAATAHSEEMNAACGPVKSCLIQWIDILVLREVTTGASGEQLQAAVCNGRFRISREGGRRVQRRGGVSLRMLKEADSCELEVTEAIPPWGLNFNSCIYKTDIRICFRGQWYFHLLLFFKPGLVR